MSHRPAFWFPVKRYGWGWGLPVRWQGWVVLASYLALVIAAGYFFRPARNLAGFAASVALLTALLVFIVAAKGERPVGWRWGRR